MKGRSQHVNVNNLRHSKNETKTLKLIDNVLIERIFSLAVSPRRYVNEFFNVIHLYVKILT